MDLLDILINLSISLIAIDVSVYTIAVSLLGSQLRRSFVYIERRLRETENEIAQIQKKASSSRQRLSHIEKELEKVKKEERKLKDNLFCLEVKGAILYPCSLFIISLTLAVIESVMSPYYPSVTLWIVLFMVGTLSWGGYRVFCTLKSVEFAAKNTPLPVFDVVFDTRESLRKTRSYRKQSLEIGIENSGYDVGEMIELSVFFPSGFKIHEDDHYEIVLQSKHDTHPLHTGVYFDIGTLHIDTIVFHEVFITSPRRKDTYKIPAYVNERQITQEEFELEILNE